MEQEGIYYFFEHEDEKHSIVLSDSINAHESYPGYDQIRYRPTYGALSTSEYIWDWLVASNIQPGMYKLNDFDYRNVRADILAVAKDPDADSQTAAGHAVSELEIYDYPGEYVDEKTESARQDGDRYARVRSQELQAQKLVCHARSDARGVAAGYLFELADHRRDDQNREYLVTSTNYRMTTEPYETDSQQTYNEPVFSCEFTAISSDQPYRPPRVTALPMIRGPQTATVVGPEGKEIFTDKYGRVKVQFRWDRYGKSDENSSCWVRVSQSWAGGKTREGAPQPHWGSMHIPHIGDEVIVEFLEGDPDHPIITGRVYNAENVPPFDLPENKHKSIFRDNYGNELVFDATPGDEHIRMYSPHHHSVLELGRSLKHTTTSDEDRFVSGNMYETALGNKTNLLLGVKADAVMGLRFLTSILGRGEYTLGFRSDIVHGWKWDHQTGPVFKTGKSTQVTDVSNPIIQHTPEYFVMDSDKHLLVLGGKQDRCAMLLEDKGMTLNVGGGEGEGRTQLETKRTRELWARASAVALATVCMGATLSSVACGVEAGKKEWKDPGSKWGFGGSLSLVALTAIAAALLGLAANKEGDKVVRAYKQKLNEVKRRTPSAKIEVTHGDGGTIEIASGSNIFLNAEQQVVIKCMGKTGTRIDGVLDVNKGSLQVK